MNPTLLKMLSQLPRLAFQKYRTNKRTLLIDPNLRSSTKVFKYSFGQTRQLAYGRQTGELIVLPDTTVRVKKIKMNIRGVIIQDIQFGNFSVVQGPLDSSCFMGSGVEVDGPTITPANRVRVLFSYDCRTTYPILFAVSFHGNGVMTG